MTGQNSPEVQASAPSSADSSATDKKTIRSAVRAARRTRRENSTPAELAESGSALVGHLTELPMLQHAACVATFEPLPTEPDVSRLAAALPPTTRILVPVLLPDKDLSWRDTATGLDVGLGGIALADVVVAPALAVGPHGERLGQGGGSYDRALPRRRPGTPVIAVVFPEETDRVFPTEPHDETVDAVATSRGVTFFPGHITHDVSAPSGPQG